MGLWSCSYLKFWNVCLVLDHFPYFKVGSQGMALTTVFVINPQPKPVVLEATVQWHSCYSQGNLRLRRELSTLSVSSYSVDSSVSYSQHRQDTDILPSKSILLLLSLLLHQHAPLSSFRSCAVTSVHDSWSNGTCERGEEWYCTPTSKLHTAPSNTSSIANCLFPPGKPSLDLNTLSASLQRNCTCCNNNFR